MPESFEEKTLRRGVWPSGQLLSRDDREHLIRGFLPEPRVKSRPDRYFAADGDRLQKVKPKQASKRLQIGLRNFAQRVLHRLLFLGMQLAFTVYLYGRQWYHSVVSRMLTVLYYHHRTPELIQRDLKSLINMPKHLSIIVELKTKYESIDDDTEELLRLCNDVAEISAWCSSAGIPMLSIYEETGILKYHMPYLHQAIEDSFQSYFVSGSIPQVRLQAPNSTVFSTSRSTLCSSSDTQPLRVLLLSSGDGRDTLVDLTKTLTEMSQKRKIEPNDVSVELVNAEITESSCGEPDLLVIMATSPYKANQRLSQRRSKKRKDAFEEWNQPSLENEASYYSSPRGDLILRGYPPWQLRLTEIFHASDSSGVGYQLFLRALHRYAKAQMRFGH